MSISNILTSLYIFNSLGEPLFLIPEYISGLLDSVISLKRLEQFLFSKEYNKDQIIKNNDNNDSKYAILIDNLDFGIIKDEVIENEKNKKDKKAESSIDDSDEREMDDISEDESEKSQKIKNRMKSNIKNSLSNPIFSRLQHTSSAKK